MEFPPIRGGLFSHALQAWLREGLNAKPPRARELNESLAQELRQRVEEVARLHQQSPPGQQPVVKRIGAPVLLFHPNQHRAVRKRWPRWTGGLVVAALAALAMAVFNGESRLSPVAEAAGQLGQFWAKVVPYGGDSPLDSTQGTGAALQVAPAPSPVASATAAPPAASALPELAPSAPTPGQLQAQWRNRYLQARHRLLDSPWWAEERLTEPATAPAEVAEVLQMAQQAAGAEVPEALLDFGQAQATGRGAAHNPAAGATALLRWLGQAPGQSAAVPDASRAITALEVALDTAISRQITHQDRSHWADALAATQALNPATLPADYWRGLMLRCLVRPTDVRAATLALQRAEQSADTVPHASLYRELAAEHLRCLNAKQACGTPCQPDHTPRKP